MVVEAVSDPNGPSEPDDAADTQMFRAFAERKDVVERPKAVGAPFRILTLLIGLAVFAGLVFLLLQL